jgi:Cu+-exporting ATPase
MTQVTHLAVEGMTCAACVTRVEKALAALEGVTQVSVSLASHSARIEGLTPFPLLIEAVEDAGYEAKLLQAGHGQENSARAQHRERHARLSAFAGLLLCLPFLVSMTLMAFGKPSLLSPAQEAVLASLLQFGLGLRFYKGALKALRGGAATMDVLVAIGTSAAYGLSFFQWQIAGVQHGGMDHGLAGPALYFESSSVVIGFVLFGKWLEERAMAETTTALRALQALQPDEAQVLDEAGESHRVPTAALREGLRALVLSGERIPADGHIIEGFADIDESMVTGESLPVAKTLKDRVIGGTLNTDGRLVIAVSGSAAQSVLAQIIAAMESAQASKAPVQKRVDRITEIFVPGILILAALTLGGWMLHGAAFTTALLHAVAVLVIACPCALGLATPTALIAGTGLAARNGLLLRDGAAIEALARTQVMVFDKTGTLTTGAITIQHVQPLGTASETACLTWAAALDAPSPHPLAIALRQRFDVQMPTSALPAVEDFKTLSGAVSGRVEATALLLGNDAAMKRGGFDLDPFRSQAETLKAQGLGVSWLGDTTRHEMLAVIGFADTPRPSAQEAIAALRTLGIDSVMLTGDTQAAARQIGTQLGITEIIAEVTPAQKAQAITELQKRGLFVTMVGDGINDAPALTAADCGIAMAQGTDIAMQASAVTLMQSDPLKAVTAIRIGRRIRQTIERGLFFAFVYNVIGLPLAALGFLSPVLAGGAMALSSVSVVANALTLRLNTSKS